MASGPSVTSRSCWVTSTTVPNRRTWSGWSCGWSSGGWWTSMAEAPFGLLAELTHRCPLQCGYCSNPVELVRRDAELDTESWRRVFDQARSLGALQIHLSGGEPLLRPDLPELVVHANSLGCYVNLVTSGVGLSRDRLRDLAARGVDHVQLSLQDATREGNDRIASIKAFDRKVEAAAYVRDEGMPLIVNTVLYRQIRE